MLRAVLMGVSGCGKTSVGKAAAAALGVRFVDADDLHPVGNVEKMRAGIALSDEDRWPWLDLVAATLAEQAPVIVACSALRVRYRDRLRDLANGPVRFIHLAGSRDMIRARLAQRGGHFMPASLLDSQFSTLEAPGADEALTLGVDQTFMSLVAEVVTELKDR